MEPHWLFRKKDAFSVQDQPILEEDDNDYGCDTGKNIPLSVPIHRHLMDAFDDNEPLIMDDDGSDDFDMEVDEDCIDAFLGVQKPAAKADECTGTKEKAKALNVTRSNLH